MVIVKLKGGLGNQMFQYALGRRISLINKVALKLDIEWFENVGNDTSREYELKHLKIYEQFASKEEIKRLYKETGLIRNFRRLIPFNRRSYINERTSSFDPAIINLRDNVYLDGVWANEKYFLDIKELIREEFELRNQSNEVNLKMTEQIGSVNSVAVHIRRGDYVSNPIANRYHGLCSIEYYLHAVSEIAKKLKDPHFFLFSDDPQWVKDNLRIAYPIVYVDHNGPEQGHEDLKLMKICKHNIIANSSFSWWGAWLNSNLDKIIYAPSRWSNNRPGNNNDCVPQAWISL